MRARSNTIIFCHLISVLGLLACGNEQRATAVVAAPIDTGSANHLTIHSAVDLTQTTRKAAQRFRIGDSGIHAEGVRHRVKVGATAALVTATDPLVTSGQGDGSLNSTHPVTSKKAFLALRANAQRKQREQLPFSVSTLSVARSGFECIRGDSQMELHSDGSVAKRFAGCSELWKNSDDSAEQSLWFPKKPTGSGDVAIQIALHIGESLPTLTSTDDKGLHFSGPGSERYFYGHGLWVDADGKRLAIPARYAGGRVVLTIPSALVESSRYPATLDPKVGPEIGTDKPVPVPTNYGYYPSLASDGSGFLSVQVISSRIRGTRVDANGNPLDLAWLDFGRADVEQYYPNAAFGSGHYFVTWSETASDGTMSIQGRMVKPDGAFEGASSLRLSDGEGTYPSAVWDGSHFVVTWLNFETDSTSIRAALFNADGTKLPGSEQQLVHNGHATNPHIAAGTAHTLITWEEYGADTAYYNVYGTRLDKSGAVTDVAPLALAPASFASLSSAVASSGSRFLVAWTTGASPYAVRGSVLDDASGTLLASDFAISRSPSDAALPTVDFDGTRFLVAWADSRDNNTIFGIPVALDGFIDGLADRELSLHGPNYISPFSSDRVNLAYNGSRHLVSFLSTGIEGSLFDTQLAIAVGSIPLTAQENNQGYPRMVWDGTNYVVAWMDERISSMDMTARAVRINDDGAVLDPDGILVTRPNETMFDVALSSAEQGSSQFIYFNGVDLPTQRSLASDGTLGEPRTFGESVLSRTPDIQSNGATYLVTAQQGNYPDEHVVGRLLDSSGNAGAEFRIDASTGNIGAHAVPIAGGYLVSYSNDGTYTVTVSDQGQVGEPTLLSSGITQISGASGDTEALIAWGNFDDARILGRFFKNGSFSGEAFTLAESTSGWSPAVAWDGVRYFVVWESNSRTLQGRTVTRTGELGADQMVIADDCTGPVLASDGLGRMLLSYVRWSNNSSSRRVYSRILSPDDNAGGGGGQTGNSATGGVTGALGGSGGTTSSTSTAPVGGNASSGGATSSSSTALVGGDSSIGGVTTSTGGTPSNVGQGGSGGSGTATTGVGGAPRLPGCSIYSHRGSSVFWGSLGAAALALAGMRRRRCQPS